MKKRAASAVLFATVLSLLVSGVAIAFTFRAQVSITESASVDYNMLPLSWDSNNDWMADNGFLNSTANDTRVQTLAGTNKPHSVATDRTLTATAIDADSQTNLYFVTGESEQETFQIIPGYSNNSSVGYVETPDNTTTEIGDNGTLSVGGAYLNESGFIVNKPYAMRLVYDSSSENVTCDTLSANTTSITLRPGGTGTVTNIDSVTGAATHWQAVNDSNDATYVHTLNSVYELDLYTCDNSTESTETINSVTMYFRIGHTGAGDNVSAKPAFFIEGTTYNGTEQSVTGSGITTKNEVFNTSPATGTAWTWDEINSMEIGLWFRNVTASNYGRFYDLYIVVSYEDTLVDETITITGVEQGEYDTLEFERDKPFNSLGVNATSFDTPYSTNLTYNLPFRQSEFNTYGANFTSIDDFEHECDPVNAVWSTTGYSFDGAGDYIDLPASTVNSTEGTFIFWVYFDRDDTSEYIFSTGGDELAIFHNNTDELRVYYDQVTEINTNLLTAYGAYTGQWLHIAFTYLEGSNGYCYINGIEVTHDTSINTGGFTPAATAIGSKSNHASPLQGDIGEFLFYDKQLTESQITQHYNATRYHFTSGSIATESSLASIPDTSANLTFFLDNSVVYADNASVSVNGTQRLWYAPNTIISSDGTTGNLTDRSGNGNTGIIRWGSNPVGVVTALGSFTSSGQPTVGSSTTTPTEDILPEAGGSSWEPVTDVPATLLTNPLRPAVTAVSDNTSLTELQVWRWYGIIFVVLVTASTAISVQSHQGITGIALGAALAVVTALSIFPGYVYAFSAIFVLGGIIAERKLSF